MGILMNPDVAGTISTLATEQSLGDLTSMMYANSSNVRAPVTVTTANILVAPANANRKSFTIWNSGGNKVFIAFGPTASTTAYSLELGANSGYESGLNVAYKGAISAIRSSGSGAVQVTEFE